MAAEIWPPGRLRGELGRSGDAQPFPCPFPAASRSPVARLAPRARSALL